MVKTRLNRGLVGLLLGTSIATGLNSCTTPKGSDHFEQWRAGQITDDQYATLEQQRRAQEIDNNGLDSIIFGVGLRMLGVQGALNGADQLAVAAANIGGDAAIGYGAAQAGASNINQNVFVNGGSNGYDGAGRRVVGQQPQEQVNNGGVYRIPGGIFFSDQELGYVSIAVSNFVRDKDGDGVILFPEEHPGIGTSFRRTEPIVFRLGTNLMSNDYTIKITDQNGETFYTSGSMNEPGKGVRVDGNLGDFDAGNYNANFFYKKRLLGTLEINVTD